MIRAIETRYKGHRLRSRLEARWAVFFNALGWEWQYEVQGYRIGWGDADKTWLPDFEIITPNNQHFYVEVKGDKDFFSDGEWLDLFDFGGGPPGFSGSQENLIGFKKRTAGMLLLGDIPEPKNRMFLPVASHHKGVWVDWRQVLPTGLAKSFTLFDAFFGGQNEQTHGSINDFQPKALDTPWGYEKLENALSAARSARFEHGEVPA